MSAPVIDYAPPRPRRKRMWVLAAVLLLAAVALTIYREPLWRSAKLAYHGRQATNAFEQCLSFELPRDTVLYADRGDADDGTPYQLTFSPPTVPPRVATVPGALKSLDHHLRAAASNDPTRAKFIVPAVTSTAIGKDEAVLFLGDFNIRSPVAPASRYVWGVVAAPYELRWMRLAYAMPAGAGTGVQMGLTSPGPAGAPPRIAIMRQHPSDWLEWFAGRRQPDGQFVIPYRLNGAPGTLSMNEAAAHDRFRFNVTHGWVAGESSTYVWCIGGRGHAAPAMLATRRPDWREVGLKQNLVFRGVAFDASGNAVVVAKARGERSELELWQVKPDSSAARLIERASLPPREIILRRDGAVAMSPDGTRVACASATTGYVIDTRTGARVATIPLPRPVERGSPDVGCSVALSDTGRVFAAISGDGRQVRWHHVDADRPLAGLPLAQVTLDGRVVLTAMGTFLFRPTTKQPLCLIEGYGFEPVMELTSLPGRGVVLGQPDPMGQWLAFLSDTDEPRDRRLGRYSFPPPTIYDVQREVVAIQCREAQEDITGAPAWSRDGSRVLWVGAWHVFVVDMPSRTVLRLRRPQNAPPARDRAMRATPFRAALSHDGSRMAIAWVEDAGRVWVAPVEFPQPPATNPSTNPQNTSVPNTPM